MKWPWSRERVDRAALDAAERRARELEDRAATNAARVIERDPWAARVLDTIHGEPHAG